MSSAVTLTASAPSRIERHARVELAVGRRAFGQIWIGATVCAVVFGGTIASSALTYVSTFPSEAARQQLAAATSGETGFAMLLGPTSSIGTVGGYTVYKCFVFLTTIGAIWALLAATRLLRGEEDAGRWQLVLAGSTRPAAATAATLGALGAAIAVVFVGTTLITMLAGSSPDVGFGLGETVLYGLSIVLPPAVFAGVGAVTSQLARTRRTATGLGMGVLGVAFVIRMIADSGPDTTWLLWATPFGWTELMEPLTRNNPWPLVPATLTTAALAVTAALLAARRDAGSGLLRSRDVTEPRPFGLRSAFGLDARLELPVLAAWCAGASAAAFTLGIIAKLATSSIPESMGDTLSKFGVEGTFVNQYFGVAFLLSATVVALLPASQLGAAATEETAGRLIHVLAGRTTRTAWFAGRLTLAGGAVVLAGVLTGLLAWLGAKSQGVDLDLSTMLLAGVNAIPTALVILGIGAVVLSIAPRAAAGSVYGVVIWSLIVDLLASMVTGVGWIGHLSVFHYMALAPAQEPDPTTLFITTAIAAALCVLATVQFRRRDLRSF